MVAKWARGLVLIALFALIAGCFLNSEPKIYPDIYIESYHPDGPLEPDTDTRLEFFIWGDPTPIATSTLVVGAFEEIEVSDISSGNYAIRVTGAGAAQAGGDYAIVVRDTTKAGAPAAPLVGAVNEPTDSDDATFPWDGGDYTSIGLDGGIARDILPDGADVDWFRLILPR
jgi:hypothetical protein